MEEIRWLLGALALQQLIYAMAWAAAARLVPDMRSMARHWALFAVATAVATLLLAQRSDLPAWAGIGLCDLSLVMATVHLRRASELFFGLRHHRLEPAVALLLAVWLMLAFNHPDDQGWRVAGVAVAVGLNTLRAVQLAHPAMQREFGPLVAWTVHGPAGVMSAVLVVYGLWALNASVAEASVFRESVSNKAIVLGLLVSTAFAHLVYGGMLLARLVGRLKHLSRHDALTGLLNRRAMDEQLEREWQRHLRQGTPYTLLLLDIDHFKSVNDRFGHACGDLALQAVSQLLSAALRPTDAAGRVGGEEFLVLLAGASAADGQGVAERLREQVAQLQLRTPQGQAMPFTASLGVAEVQAGDSSQELVQQRADQALYAAKQRGRNRVVGSAEGQGLRPVVETGLLGA